MKITLTEDDQTELLRWLKNRSVVDTKVTGENGADDRRRFDNEDHMATLKVSNPTLNTWRTRYLESGIEGLRKGKTRPSRIPALTTEKVQGILSLTLTGKLVAEAHWRCRTVAQQVSISRMAVHGIWREHK
jgi:hypothetical protein